MLLFLLDYDVQLMVGYDRLKAAGWNSIFFQFEVLIIVFAKISYKVLDLDSVLDSVIYLNSAIFLDSISVES